jgi:magnesium chelatase family protein
MLSIISSATLQGIDAELVQVEVNSGESGEPKLILVGLPDAAVKESDDRVLSALGNSGFSGLRARTGPSKGSGPKSLNRNNGRTHLFTARQI